MTKTPTQLPIDQVIPELISSLQAHPVWLLSAPPGAGKTTRVPLAVMAEPWLAGQKVVVLQPRRIAARAAAARMSEQLGVELGQTVGFRVRGEAKVSRQTRIEVVTEGLFVRQLQSDPSLDGVGLVIMDEFHERHLDTDLSLALLLSSMELYSDLRQCPLKLLIMSATLDNERLAELLCSRGPEPVPHISCEGRSFPVDIRYFGQYRTQESQLPRWQAAIASALGSTTGDLLVFLPGVGEISRVRAGLLASHGEQNHVVDLHGGLSLNQQRAALAPAPSGKRKITLATSIAQTSLTLTGITAVIDSGLIRQPRFDPSTGLTRLALEQVSQATAEQRAGRAGRLGPGVCIRLWSEPQQLQRSSHDRPEIEQADLTDLALNLLAWGEPSADDLLWLDPPDSKPYHSAMALLASLGAHHETVITDHGRALMNLPLTPRLGHMLLVAKKLGVGRDAALLGALLSNRDPMAGAHTADIAFRLEAPGLKSNSVLAKDYRQLLRAIGEGAKQDNAPSLEQSPDILAQLIARAFPDRVAKAKGNGRYTMANGRGVELSAGDPLARHQWLAIAHTAGALGKARDRVALAAPLDPELFAGPLADLLDLNEFIGWDETTGRLSAQQQWCVGQLVWRAEALAHFDPEVKAQAVIDRVLVSGLALFSHSQASDRWRRRVTIMRTLDSLSAYQWPDVSDAGLLACIDDWLRPYIHTINNLADFARLDFHQLITGMLPWDLQQRLEQQLPTKFTVPSGSSITLDYGAEKPVLAVRLQEMFGLRDTPALAGGRLPIVIHLLSPAGRPLQITQDLAGFWAGSYHAVRKEMKGRYPKHYWPEDPYSVAPTARAKPRGG